MRNMAKLVSEIVSLNNKDLELLAQAIAWYGSGGASDKAEKLEFFLSLHIREQNERMAKIRPLASANNEEFNELA